MRPRCIALVVSTTLLPLLVAFAGRQPTAGEASAGATVYGTVFAYWGPELRPAQGITVYLIPAQKSVGLTRLQEESCRRLHRSGISEHEANVIGGRYLNNAIALIPHLPSISKTKTDRRGVYRFPNVPAGKVYKVVGLQPYEDHEYFEIRTTGVLRSGEKLRVDLDERDPWWEIECGPEPRGQ